ncbi:MAG: kinase/pyrophosphorylase [Gammaproteobacteria bacterium]|nr:kinase/pyrophosphorylase [Gammaproteobacteria bacterium]
MERAVFFVSDRTGIAAETLGLSLLAQFNGIKFKKYTHRFIDSLDKAQVVCDEIHRAAVETGVLPIVFSTMIDDEMRRAVTAPDCILFDLVDTFISPLEAALGQKSSHTIGRAREAVDQSKYNLRMDAVNYALTTDDGLHTQDYRNADVIIVGVSRSGKTPSCLYLALTFGVYAANYPLTPEDLEDQRLPTSLVPHRRQLYGLTIDAERLQQIRRERKAEGVYSSLRQCQYEVAQAEALFRAENIPYLSTTTMSVEEIATTILHHMKLQWRLS